MFFYFSESIPDGSGSFQTDNDDVDDVLVRLLQSASFKEKGNIEGRVYISNIFFTIFG